MRQTSDDVDDRVCLLIHNVDGPALRDAESQQCLAQISCCPQVHVVASIDHVNAPLCKFLAHVALSLPSVFTVKDIIN